MAAVPYAHIVANMLRRKSPKGAKVTLAPNPKDIVRPPPPAGVPCHGVMVYAC